MVIRHRIKELLGKTVLRGHEIHSKLFEPQFISIPLSNFYYYRREVFFLWNFI